MKDKIIIITGGSQGLGKAVAKKLAGEGAKVVLVAEGEEMLRQAKEEIGANAYTYVCDITFVEQIQKTVADIIRDLGRIDILINNAGLWTDEKLEEANPELRRKVIETNALGTIEFTKAVEPIFRKQNSGHILNVISTSGGNDTSAGDNRLWQTYGASKWAVAGFTRALRDSLSDTKIKVTGFYPGGFDSNMYERASRGTIEETHNQPWMMRAEDVADALIFCLTRPDDVLVEKIVVTKIM